MVVGSAYMWWRVHTFSVISVLTIFDFCILSIVVLLFSARCIHMNSFTIEQSILMLIDWKDHLLNEYGYRCGNDRPSRRMTSNRNLESLMTEDRTEEMVVDISVIMSDFRNHMLMRELLTQAVENIEKMDAKVRLFGAP